MIWVAGRSPTLVSQNLKATTLTYLAILIAWLTEMLLPTIGAGKKIVLDNASFHRCKLVRKVVEAAGCELIYSLFVDYRVQLESLPSVYGQLSHTPKSLKRLYLPKYSPDLNPIEPVVLNIRNKT
jgi:transposase